MAAPFTRIVCRHYLAAVERTLTDGRMLYGRLIRRFAGLALRRPSLLVPLLAAAWRFRARDWHRRPPFVPLPPKGYVEWRLYTAYGDENAMPPAADLARYLTWSRSAARRSNPPPGGA